MDIDEAMNEEPHDSPERSGGSTNTGHNTGTTARDGSMSQPPEAPDAPEAPSVSDEEIEDFAYGPEPDDPFEPRGRRQQPPPPGARAGATGPRVGPPPSGTRPMPPRRLYRHPKGQLGGVAAGLAHYFAIDVAMIRFLLVLSILTGVTPFIYIAAWIAIPKALVWPPPGPQGPPSWSGLIESRTVRTGGLILLGLIVLGNVPFGMNNFAIAAALVAAGVWLLNRSPEQNRGAATAGGAPLGDPITPPTTNYADPSGQYGYGESPYADAWERPAYAYETTAPGEAPTPPRNWRPLKWLGGLAALGALIPIGILGLLIASGEDTGSFGGPVGEQFYSPHALEEINPSYSMSAGEMTLDLSNVDFRGLSRTLNVEAGVGEITVVVPPNINVVNQAEAKIGEVDTSRLTNDGSGENGQLTINAGIRAGQITIMTGHCTNVPPVPPVPIDDGSEFSVEFGSDGISVDVADPVDHPDFDEDFPGSFNCIGG